jgi:hypothetical protein
MTMKKTTSITKWLLSSLLIIALALLIAGCAAEGRPGEIGELTPETIQETRPAADQSEESPAPPLETNVEGREATGANAGITPNLHFAYDDMTATAVIFEVAPAHTRFAFEGYAVTDTIHEPHIALYSTSDYEAASQTAAEQIATLRQLLSRRTETIVGSPPFLPPIRAKQIITAQIAYLDFQNGSGIRYLAQRGHGAVFTPINNSELFYTFQGLTDDGRYYVSAVFPVSHPDLPAGPAEIPQEFLEDQALYLDSAVQWLNEAEASSFWPDLAALDAVIASIEVDGDPISDPGDEREYPAAVRAAVQMVREGEGLSPEEIEIVSFQGAEWPDGCLGLSEPDEACTLAIVPGWLIILRVDGQTYEVRTDESGSHTRWRWQLASDSESYP